jgi:hypothetical protein
MGVSKTHVYTYATQMSSCPSLLRKEFLQGNTFLFHCRNWMNNVTKILKQSVRLTKFETYSISSCFGDLCKYAWAIFPHDSELCVLCNTPETPDCHVSDSAVYKNVNWLLQPHAANYNLSDVIRRDSEMRSQRLRLKAKDWRDDGLEMMTSTQMRRPLRNRISCCILNHNARDSTAVQWRRQLVGEFLPIEI